MRVLQSDRKGILFLIDFAIFCIVYVGIIVLASLTGTGFQFGAMWYMENAAIFMASDFVVRNGMKTYSSVWRYANINAYRQMLLADTIGCAAAVLFTKLSGAYIGLWMSISLMYVFSLTTLASRFCYQRIYRHQNTDSADINKIGVAIIGAGRQGALLAEEMLRSEKSHYRPVCFVDKDAVKAGNWICGVKVYAEGRQTLEKLRTLPVQEIVIAIPGIDSEKLKYIYDLYTKEGFKVRVYKFPLSRTGEAQPASERAVHRELRIEDLLFRDSISIDGAVSEEFYSGKSVIVTGGGGSIGSELCRQIAKRGPKELIILDSYENNAYDIQQELTRIYGKGLNMHVEIASVRDTGRVMAIFGHYRPELVFHAAADKHVPLMEHSGAEAVKTNVFGTYNVANAAEKYGAEKFVLISTDKAVNPTNVMGATKRMCEFVVQSRAGGKTVFSAVRFGNVLGSNGSVIPLFKKQIDQGGPITITDKRITRYFMTIPEAVQLVMQTGAMARSGELFVLDMGRPVKIIDLAENMVRLSGLIPYKDIEIVEIGLRPGEKLYEELLIKTEELDKTENDMIFVERDRPLDRGEVEKKLDILRAALFDGDSEIGCDRIKRAMKSVVPTYKDPEEVNPRAEEKEEMRVSVNLRAMKAV